MGGGWSDKTKLILISTLVEVVVEVEVELGKIEFNMAVLPDSHCWQLELNYLLLHSCDCIS